MLENAYKDQKIRRPTQAKKTKIIDYSQIKLPASMFVHYLEADSKQFLADCERYPKLFWEYFFYASKCFLSSRMNAQTNNTNE